MMLSSKTVPRETNQGRPEDLSTTHCAQSFTKSSWKNMSNKILMVSLNSYFFFSAVQL